ncbi:MAG: SEL1-like repeat protein [Methylobacteriaceae bacterium]|jgi:TPR repeat protein|nr:SEL1-like repeat protein [Methylobacteriaceae bacterium]
MMNSIRFRFMLAGILVAAYLPVFAGAATPEAGAKEVSQKEQTRTGPVVDLAYGAYQRREYKTAMKEAMDRLETDKRDTAAMTLLGELHANGWGVLPDAKAAEEWYLAAARLGDANAMTALGLMNLSASRTDPAKLEQARLWFEKAAELLEPAASHQLALMLLATNDPVDDKRAVELLTVAANAGVHDAQHDLGEAYLIGRGVKRNYGDAAKWFEKAAAFGNTASEIELGILLYQGQGIKRDEERSARMFMRAAYKGNPVAQNRLARLYIVGRGVSKDLAEAAAWHQLASMRGLADPVLNSELANLTKDELERADRLVRERISVQ